MLHHKPAMDAKHGGDGALGRRLEDLPRQVEGQGQWGEDAIHVPLLALGQCGLRLFLAPHRLCHQQESQKRFPMPSIGSILLSI